MSTPKHTPGPWEAIHPEGDSNALDVYPVGNRHYKIMHGKWGGMADARLVSAAPDLLAALKNNVRPCIQVTFPKPEDWHRVGCGKCMACQTIAAIAKAEG